MWNSHLRFLSQDLLWFINREQSGNSSGENHSNQIRNGRKVQSSEWFFKSILSQKSRALKATAERNRPHQIQVALLMPWHHRPPNRSNRLHSCSTPFKYPALALVEVIDNVDLTAQPTIKIFQKREISRRLNWYLVFALLKRCPGQRYDHDTNSDVLESCARWRKHGFLI